MKKILVLLILLCMTGCSVQYDLTITNEGEVKEKFVISIPNEDMLSEYSSIEEYLDYYSNLYLQNEGYEDFSIDTKKSKPDSYFTVKNNYKNLDEYVQSLSFKSMFNNATIERIGKYISFTTSKNAYLASLKNNDLISEESKYDNFKIRIKFYNEVTASNAEEIDEKNNIYTWIVSEDSETDYIYFKIGPKVRYGVVVMDYIQNNLASIVIITSTIVLLAATIAFIYIKSKKNNEV